MYKNYKVVAGDYKGQGVVLSGKNLTITLPWLKTVKIKKDTVEAYEVLNGTEQTSSISAVSRAAIGSFFFGQAGLAAAMGAKRTGTYLVAIQFKDGKRSLLELDDQALRALTIALF